MCFLRWPVGLSVSHSLSSHFQPLCRGTQVCHGKVGEGHLSVGPMWDVSLINCQKTGCALAIVVSSQCAMR